MDIGTHLEKRVAGSFPVPRLRDKAHGGDDFIRVLPGGKTGLKRFGVLTLAVLVALAGAVMCAPGAAAAPVAPTIMPGFPMIAGPVVMMMWTPVPGATGYNIYMNGKPIAKSL